MTSRARVFLAIFLALVGCGEPKPPESPYAPGLVPGAEAVDGVLVGHRLMDAGEFELAQKAYTRAAVTQGMTADILAGLGSANLGLGRLTTAERLLRKAVEKDQESPEIWNNLGVVLVEKREYLEAEQVFRRAYALDNGESDSIRDNLRLALAKSENSQYDEIQDQDYKLVRRGSGDYLVRKIP